MFEETPRSATD